MGCLPDPGIEKFARDLRVDQVRGTLRLCASCKTCLECSSFSRPPARTSPLKVWAACTQLVKNGGRHFYPCRSPLPLRRLHAVPGHRALLPSSPASFCQGQENSFKTSISGVRYFSRRPRERKHRALRVDRLKSPQPSLSGMGSPKGAVIYT